MSWFRWSISLVAIIGLLAATIAGTSRLVTPGTEGGVHPGCTSTSPLPGSPTTL